MVLTYKPVLISIQPMLLSANYFQRHFPNLLALYYSSTTSALLNYHYTIGFNQCIFR